MLYANTPQQRYCKLNTKMGRRGKTDWRTLLITNTPLFMRVHSFAKYILSMQFRQVLGKKKTNQVLNFQQPDYPSKDTDSEPE